MHWILRPIMYSKYRRLIMTSIRYCFYLILRKFVKEYLEEVVPNFS